MDPPSVEGWHYGAEWIDSGSLVRRINFSADRVSDLRMPGVQSIVRRIKAQGGLDPSGLVDSCLDLVGPVEVTDETKSELVAVTEQGGPLQWDSEEQTQTSSRRIADLLALIASTREFQFC